MKINGEIFIQGRYKDLIIRAGENIAPAAIERVIDTLPEVIASQIVGVHDDIAGEVPFAVVKLADGRSINSDKVHDVVVDKLGTLYMPSETVSLQELGVDDFPKTDSGKVQKAKLKELVTEYLRSRDGILKNTSSSDEAANKSLTIVNDLHRIWSNLLSLSKERLATSIPLVELADSITIMRSIHKIKRELGHTMTVREIMENPTIENQARLLQGRGQDSSSAVTEVVPKAREGPPTAAIWRTHSVAQSRQTRPGSRSKMPRVA